MAKFLMDMDPNEPSRPLRDGEWIKKTYKALASEISLIYHNWTRSGSQAGDATTVEGVNEWVLNFAGRAQQHVMYAILVLDSMTMQHLGKALPVGGRDSGVLGEESSVSTPSPFNARKRQLATERKRKQRAKMKRTLNVDDDVEVIGTTAMADALNTQTKMEGLKALLGVVKEGTPEHDHVIKALLKASGIVIVDGDDSLKQ